MKERWFGKIVALFAEQAGEGAGIFATANKPIVFDGFDRHLSKAEMVDRLMAAWPRARVISALESRSKGEK